MRRITIYTRADCCLCDQAHDLIAAQAARHPLTIETVDIAGDAALEARYGERIPVVLIDGRPRFFGRVHPVLLERLLAAGKPPERR